MCGHLTISLLDNLALLRVQSVENFPKNSWSVFVGICAQLVERPFVKSGSDVEQD